MKKIFLKNIIFILLLLFMIIPIFVSATGGTSESDPVSLTNPLGATKDIPTLIGYAIKAVMGIVGSLALVMIIYGGFVWMTAAGNAEKVSQGKNILIWAIIGLVVIFSAYILVANIINVATTGNLSTPTQ